MKMKKETTYFLVCPKCKKIHNVDEWANHIKESERERVLKEVEKIIDKDKQLTDTFKKYLKNKFKELKC
jgi:uncharacterized membrane protein